MTNASVGIAGAGIMGRLVAWELVNRGYRVSLFDRASHTTLQDCQAAVQSAGLNHQACSYSAAGMLTPYSEAESADSMVVRLGLASLGLWQSLQQSVTAMMRELGRPPSRAPHDTIFGLSQYGTLVVSHAQDRGDYQRFLNVVLPQFEHAPLQVLDRHAMQRLEPEIASGFDRGLLIETEAWLCPYCVMHSLSQVLLDLGVQWHAGARVSAVNAGEILLAGPTRDIVHRFDWAIDCRGLGAKPQMPDLRAVRGELVWLHAPEVRLGRLLRLIHPHYRIYIVPRTPDQYLIGATQIESEDCSPISVRSTLELLSAAYSVHPGFGEARVLRSQVNLRPALPSNQPRLRFAPGLLRINGLFRHGFLTGPAIAREARSLLENSQCLQSVFDGLIDTQILAEVS